MAAKSKTHAPTTKAELIAVAAVLGVVVKGGRGAIPILQILAAAQRRGERLDLNGYKHERIPTGTGGRKVTFKVNGKGRPVTVTLTVREIRERTGNTNKRGRLSDAAVREAAAQIHGVAVDQLTDVSVVELDAAGVVLDKGDKPEPAPAKAAAAPAEGAKPKPGAKRAPAKGKSAEKAAETSTDAPEPDVSG